MKAVCSWCGKNLGDISPHENLSTTHCMCPECEEYFVNSIEIHRLGDFLDRFDKPVLVVDSAGRDIAANQTMADMLGKPRREFYGLMGGEIQECNHSRNPAAFTQAVHGLTCTMKLLIEQVQKDGIEHHDVPAYFDRNGRRNYFFISVRMEQSHIRLIISEILNAHAGFEAARGITL